MNFPLVSVVITTKNEEKNIENCLKSILNQTYPRDKIEIIVVDNNSSDRTKEIVQTFKQSTLKPYKLPDFINFLE
ncbi:glycosyltransferase [Patescibacteria group bacterium]|nr:glycosyltransferase [Patescibacteria group bacterium]